MERRVDVAERASRRPASRSTPGRSRRARGSARRRSSAGTVKYVTLSPPARRRRAGTSIVVGQLRRRGRPRRNCGAGSVQTTAPSLVRSWTKTPGRRRAAAAARGRARSRAAAERQSAARLGAAVVVVERLVDAVEERRAQRRVGRDVGDQQPDGRDERAPRAPAVPAVRAGSSPGGFEHVAGLPHRLDQRRPERVELLAQVAHVRLDDVRVAAEVVVPDVLEDLRPS